MANRLRSVVPRQDSVRRKGARLAAILLIPKKDRILAKHNSFTALGCDVVSLRPLGTKTRSGQGLSELAPSISETIISIFSL